MNTIAVNGISVRYQVEGNGPWVTLSHSLTCDLTMRDDLAAPTLVIAGAEDPGTPPGMSEVMASAIPGARLEVIPSSSHLSCIEQPAIFNRMVADFLRG